MKIKNKVLFQADMAGREMFAVYMPVLDRYKLSLTDMNSLVTLEEERLEVSNKNSKVLAKLQENKEETAETITAKQKELADTEVEINYEPIDIEIDANKPLPLSAYKYLRHFVNFKEE